MRFLLVPALLALAACTEAQGRMAAAILGAAPPSGPQEPVGATNPDSGVKPGSGPTFASEAKDLEGKAGKLETVEVAVKPDDADSKRSLMSYLLNDDWILVGSTPAEDGSLTTWRFIRPAKLRVETPIDGRKPEIIEAPK